MSPVMIRASSLAHIRYLHKMLLLTLSKLTLWYRMSCVACRLKLSSTFEKGQISKCKRATDINKNSSGSPNTVPFSAMAGETLSHFRSNQDVHNRTFTSLKRVFILFFIENCNLLSILSSEFINKTRKYIV